MKPNKNIPTIKYRRGRRAVFSVVLGLLVFVSVGSLARPAQAIFGIGDISVTIGDIPRTIFQFIDKAESRVAKVLKTATDIAFKNSLEILNAKIAQEIVTQVSSAGPGQKPLFLTNPKTFFRDVANSAAGTFIDEFTKGLTGERGPSGPFTTSRQRFLISRLLRSAIGSPLDQCRQDCRTAFSVDGPGVSPNVSGPLQEPKDVTGNDHYKRAYLVNYALSTVTRPAFATDQNGAMVCRHVALPLGPVPAGQNYMPWQIAPGTCDDPNQFSYCRTTTKECKRRQEEAVYTERAASRQETDQCLRDCQNGLAGAATQAINTATATDVFSATANFDAAQAPSAIANALRRDRSDIGQLLQAAADLTSSVQTKVTGENTRLTSGSVPRTSRVSDVVLVPREAGQQSLLSALTGGNDAKKVYTGTSAADIIKGLTAFINSPVGRLLASYFKNKCGLNPDACRGPSQPNSQLGQLLFGTGGATGVAGARLQFAQFGKVDFLTGDPGRNEVDVGDELSSSGLIDAQFRTAIQDQLTIQEALSRGLLDPRKTFGFDRNGIQPKEGYAYRALQYLRKFRVTPVGWELAADYSRRFDPRDLSLGFLTQHYNLCGNTLVCSNDQNKICTSSTDCGTGTCGLAEGEKTKAVCDNTVASSYLKSCQTDVDCNGGSCGPSPYCGLVDPNWVLKAPQTYCRRQGAGEEILTKEFICDQDNNVSAADAATPGADAPNCNGRAEDGFDVGRWVISRNANTCADTQSCIAENDDGTCIGFGYCVQERQAFKFDGTQCSPENTSCTTYTDGAGEQTSYLASTLDFRNCNADVAGCKWYCQVIDPATQEWTCSVDPSVGTDKINFTDNAQTCTSSQNGCRKFVRTTAGSNLLPNSGFEIYTGADIDSGAPGVYNDGAVGWITAGTSLTPVTADDPVISGGNTAAAKFTSGGTATQTINAGSSLYERIFAGSVRARADASCSAELILGTSALSVRATQTMAVTSSWQSYSVMLQIPPEGAVSLANLLTLTIDGSGCGSGLRIDSAQLEESNLTQYKEYNAVNVIHMNGTRRQCTSEDVGCEEYTRTSNRQKVTAVVRDTNRCSADKVGCATYALEPIIPMPARLGGNVNIVAPRGTQCSAANVGCEEYTNLDEVARGGEGKEYYKSVKQCVKPDPTNPNQVTYYTWIGDATRGFVLRAHDLLQSNLGAYPCTSVNVVTTPSGVPSCNDTAATVAAASCSAADLATNPDCAEFYDTDLDVWYRLRSRTVSVTAECRAYRNTADQTDTDPATGNPIPGNDANIYFLSSKENVSCPAAANSCRAYTGNAGRTTRSMFGDTFEDGTVGNWEGGQPSSQSVNLGGHSMTIPASGAAYTKTSVLEDGPVLGRSYVLTFIAAAAAGPGPGPSITGAFGIGNAGSFAPNPGQQFSGVAVTGWNDFITPPGPEWQSYTFGPLRLTTPPGPNLGLMTSGGVYIDNVTLTEITDSVYLLSNNVPSCDPGDIGCDAFRDRAGQSHYLKSFTRICSDQVVGCEALIDTQNSNSPFSQTVKGEITPSDAVVTFVNNRNAYCPASAKGCQALGLPIYATDGDVASFKTVYLKNDPDRHVADLCLNTELMCRAFTTTDGTAAFFKDPNGQICEFRSDNTEAGGQWFVSGTNFRCPALTILPEGRPVGPSCAPTCNSGDRTGRACLSDADCPNATTSPACVGDASAAGRLTGGAVGQCVLDTDCSGGNRCVYQAGSCPSSEGGCNEYRDPSDPINCRSECPLIQQGGSPVYVDQSCAKTVCRGNSATDGQNCQTSSQCGSGGQCVGLNGSPASGFPGCRSYYYLRQTVEDNTSDCSGEINLEVGCRPFNDTSRTDLNFRGL